MMLEGHVSLSIKQKILRDGKEGCARETQEGCLSPAARRRRNLNEPPRNHAPT